MKRLLSILIILLSFNVYATNTSTIVMDVNTGRILYENNAHERRLIASTTKIMTFVVAYEYAKDFLDVYVEAGNEILKMYGTSIYISYHEKMLLRDLLYGLMLRSGNDAASVIANFVGGSEEGFVKLMNKKAKAIGMNNTVFNNPHGLDEKTKNYSTAYDMAKLSRYASSIPFYREVTSTKYYKVQTDKKTYSWVNRNKMLFTYPLLVSGKTGYTPNAGKCLVTSSKKDNLHLTIVTLNDANHYENHAMLYNEMFQKYQNYMIMSKEDFSMIYPNRYIKNDILYPMTTKEISQLNIELFIDDNISTSNVVKVMLDNKEIISERIYYLEKDNNIKNNKLVTWFKNLFQKILKT